MTKMRKLGKKGEKFVLFLTVFSVLCVLIYDRSSYREKVVLNYPDLPLTSEQLIHFFNWNNPKACKTINYKIAGQPMCSDETVNPIRAHCIVYSFSFNHHRDNWAFENGMESKGCEVYNFNLDSMADSESFLNRTGHNDIYGVRLGKEDRTDPITGNEILTFKRIVEPLQHDKGRIIDYLKLDIEGDEWDVLPEMIASGSLSKIRQLGVELHLNMNRDDELLDCARKIQTLENSGMVRFHSKEKPCSSRSKLYTTVNQVQLKCYEMAWYQGLIP